MSYSKVHSIDITYIDMAAELQDSRPMMLRRDPNYTTTRPMLQARLGESTFFEINAHELYDALTDLLRGGNSLSGIVLVKHDIASYSSKELADMAELAKLSEEQTEDLGPDNVTTIKGEV